MNRPSYYPCQVPYPVIASNPDPFIDTICQSLQSTFLMLPRGPGFVAYPEFSQAYEVLKRHTSGFRNVESALVMAALAENALAFVVLRTILGFSPPELAYLASEYNDGITISQSFARSLDRKVRDNHNSIASLRESSYERVEAMVDAASQAVQEGAADTPNDMIHRLDKADTRRGLISLQHAADEGLPYAMVLYERFLGRPFASHRDAVSGLVGDIVENAVEAELRKYGISFRRMGHAESIEGFDQAPDFIITDEWNHHVVIEAKIAEDDGTARDKVTRVQHLAEISKRRKAQNGQPFQVVACIEGRGFSIRREDMRKLLEATEGKVLTLEMIDQLVPYTRLKEYATREPPG